MKKKEFTKIKEDNKDEAKKGILAMIVTKKEELAKTKMEMNMGKEKNLKKAKALRKDIAQLMSI